MLWTPTRISDWADRTFGRSDTNIRIAVRANEEMSELLRALSTDDHHPKAAEEAADVFIVLYRLVRNLNADIFEEIDKKMAKNELRTWQLDDTGHGYHVRKKEEVNNA